MKCWDIFLFFFTHCRLSPKHLGGLSQLNVKEISQNHNIKMNNNTLDWNVKGGRSIRIALTPFSVYNNNKIEIENTAQNLSFSFSRSNVFTAHIIPPYKDVCWNNNTWAGGTPEITHAGETSETKNNSSELYREPKGSWNASVLKRSL